MYYVVYILIHRISGRFLKGMNSCLYSLYYYMSTKRPSKELMQCSNSSKTSFKCIIWLTDNAE